MRPAEPLSASWRQVYLDCGIPAFASPTNAHPHSFLDLSEPPQPPGLKAGGKVLLPQALIVLYLQAFRESRGQSLRPQIRFADHS
jgi:hypothetical protein